MLLKLYNIKTVLPPLLAANMLLFPACGSEKQSDRDVADQRASEIVASIVEAAAECSAVLTRDSDAIRAAITQFTDAHLNEISEALTASAPVSLKFAPGESIVVGALTATVETGGYSYQHTTSSEALYPDVFAKVVNGRTLLQVSANEANATCTLGSPSTDIACRDLQTGISIEGWKCGSSFAFAANKADEVLEVQHIENPHQKKHVACRASNCVNYSHDIKRLSEIAALGYAGAWPNENLLDQRLVKLTEKVR